MPLLMRHPDTPPGAIALVEAELLRSPGGVTARFRAVGDVSRLVVPVPATPERSDDLWRTTCFEIFLGDEGEAYREVNLSPSSRWACYAFDAPRSAMRDAPADIAITTARDNKSLTLEAAIQCEVPDPARIGLTAVIEENDGILRYWSVAFAPGRPDFHAPAIRTLILDGVDAQ